MQSAQIDIAGGDGQTILVREVVQQVGQTLPVGDAAAQVVEQMRPAVHQDSSSSLASRLFR